MHIRLRTTVALTLLTAANPAWAAYSLLRDYSGSTFFDRWSYYGHYDNLTNGDTIFVNQSLADSLDLTYINSAGNAIIKVDNTSTVPYNEKRNTVRIASTDLYSTGTLWVFDAVHVPYGCSVWPAFWSQAQSWPSGGEIDVFEGVNLQTANQYALHTTNGCTASGTSSTMSGTLSYSNCSSSANSNSGCTISETKADSYGSAFNAAGGGVFVTEFATTGISIWFFSRANVPSDLLTSNSSAVPSPSNWGTPSAYYPSSSCDIATHFANQQLILDITLCGDWAGNAAVFNATCSGVCYTDFVLNSSSYANAHFEIPSIRIYTDGTGTSTSISGSSSSSGTSSGTAATSKSTTTSSAAKIVSVLGEAQKSAVLLALVAVVGGGLVVLV
ncbi:hypothetical protein T439DRAFT_342968 [Meredithblackwellia eburnea MCA 4105]